MLLGRHCQDETVDENVLFWYAVGESTVHYLFCDLKASVSSGGYTVLIQCQADNSGSVFGDKRKNTFHDGFLAVHGVHDRFAVVYPQSGLQYVGLGRVDLKRYVDNGLYRFDSLYHHLFFVDSGCSDIDIQDIGTCFDLLYSLAQDIIHVFLRESLFKAFFTGRVDSFPDNTRLADDACPERCADSQIAITARCGITAVFTGRRRLRSIDAGCFLGKHIGQFSYIVRVRSAASPEDANAEWKHLLCDFGKFIRKHIIGIGHRIGKTCVRLYDDREPCPL